MKCNKRNKKLFTHIALAALMIFVLIILTDTFSGKGKIVEGLSGGGELGEYHRQAINLKIDVVNDPETAEKFKSYVNLYLQSLSSKSENTDDKDKKKQEESSNQDKEAIEKILAEKLGDGGNTFNTLKTAIMTDPESQYSEWVANNTPKLSEQFKVAIKNFMEKIDELYKEMKKE